MSISMVLALPVVESTPTAKNQSLMLYDLNKLEEWPPLDQELKTLKAMPALKRVKKKKIKQKKNVKPQISLPIANIFPHQKANQAPGSNGIVSRDHIICMGFGSRQIRKWWGTKIQMPSRSSKILNRSQNPEALLVFVRPSADSQPKPVKEEMEKVVKKTKMKQRKTVKPEFSLTVSNRFSTLGEKQAPGSNVTLTKAQISTVFGYSQIRKAREKQIQPQISGLSREKIKKMQRNAKMMKKMVKKGKEQRTKKETNESLSATKDMAGNSSGIKQVEKSGAEEYLNEPQDPLCTSSSLSGVTSHSTVETQKKLGIERQQKRKIKSAGQFVDAKVKLIHFKYFIYS